MNFKLFVDVRFEAQGLEDAFEKISKHFQKLAEGSLTSNLLNVQDGGVIHLAPETPANGKTH